MFRQTPYSRLSLTHAVLLLVLLALATPAFGSQGDQLPEFRECTAACEQTNCGGVHPVPVPLLHRALLWTCESECDQACQHTVTDARLRRGQPVVQFHGKWPFRRLLGLQEPLSVAFSLGNLWAHATGLRRIRTTVPVAFSLRRFYERAGQLGMTTWLLSALFHARDFPLTEQLDYLAAGATVLYGLYYALVRVVRLDRPDAAPLLRAWTTACLGAYAAHVAYLELVRWNYSYNMTVNIAVGLAQNLLWIVFSVRQYRRLRQPSAAMPGIIVVMIMLALCCELLDFPPIAGALDAHALWHLGTIAPTVMLYIFLMKDSLELIATTDHIKL